MAHELTELERESAEPIPDADELAGGFELVVSDHLKSDADYQAQMSNLGFGVDYSDYMAHATWHADGGWTRKVIEP